MRSSVALLTLAFLLAGCKADPPGRLERKFVTAAEHDIFIRNKNEKNPLKDTAETRADGKQAFAHYCVACHGNDGQNTGVPFVNHISPPIPSLASADVQRFSDGQLKWILDYGIWPSGMPGSKGVLSEDELWSIVAYLRHLPPMGSQGVPDLYTR